MTTARMLRTAKRAVSIATTRLGQENRQLWLSYPSDLIRFGRRLISAAVSFGLAGRFPSVGEVLRQVVRSTFRGLIVAVGLGVAIGLGMGAVADRFGMMILPLLEQTVLIAVIRDGAPLILAIVMAARMGSSVAARLGDDRQTPLPHGAGPFDRRTILHLALPPLAAGMVSSWIFYRVGVFLIIPGYQSLGFVTAFLEGVVHSAFVPIDRSLAIGRAVDAGQIKAALYGLIVAFSAAGLGIATNERRIPWPRKRAEAVQHVVWGSAVLALVAVMIAAAVSWQLQGTD